MHITAEEAQAIAKQLGYRGDLEELRLGIEAEAEEHARTHKLLMSDTSIHFFAGLIAQDHLREDPHYYTTERKLKNLARGVGHALSYTQMHHIGSGA